MQHLMVAGGDVWLSKDFYISKNKNEGQTKIKVGVANAIPVYSTAPMDSSGNPMYIGNQGDIMFNANPDPDVDTKSYAGWICVKSFVLDEIDSSNSMSAEWFPFGKIDITV